MSDADYQRASRQHRAMGVFTDDGARGMVNVEVMGHALIIQHYRQVEAGKSYVELHSPASHAYLMHLHPVAVGVTWTMTVEPDPAGESVFSCSVDIELSPVLSALARATGVTSAIRRHTREETYGYAADIERKLGLPASQPTTAA
jgi:hypothetical protein